MLTELMDQYQIDPKEDLVYFSQLYGMSDSISYNLAKAGYRVVKYVPYGPVEKVMPYLSRRAAENSSMAGQSSREFELVQKEMKRRRLG
jgi:proline dehydrogenase